MVAHIVVIGTFNEQQGDVGDQKVYVNDYITKQTATWFLVVKNLKTEKLSSSTCVLT